MLHTFKRISFTALPILAILFTAFAFTIGASAHTSTASHVQTRASQQVGTFNHLPKSEMIKSIPLTQNCSGGCAGNVTWGGANNGGLTTVYVPNYTGSSSNNLQRYIEFNDNQGDIVDIGYCFGSAGGTCTHNGGNWFVQECTPSCFIYTDPALNSSDKNHTVEIGTFLGSSGDQLAVIQNTGSGSSPCPHNVYCDIGQFAFQFQSIKLVNYIKNSWNNTLQGSFTWINNQYFNSAFHYQIVSPGVSSATGAAMGIKVAPAAGNNGGTMEGCNEEGVSSISNC